MPGYSFGPTLGLIVFALGAIAAALDHDWDRLIWIAIGATWCAMYLWSAREMDARGR